jgi:hypothetical protein
MVTYEEWRWKDCTCWLCGYCIYFVRRTRRATGWTVEVRLSAESCHSVQTVCDTYQNFYPMGTRWAISLTVDRPGHEAPSGAEVKNDEAWYTWTSCVVNKAWGQLRTERIRWSLQRRFWNAATFGSPCAGRVVITPCVAVVTCQSGRGQTDPRVGDSCRLRTYSREIPHISRQIESKSLRAVYRHPPAERCLW